MPTSRVSLGFHIAQGDALHMAAARAAGGRFVVLVFNWDDIEPAPGYVYWEAPDAALRAAEFYDLEIIARLDQPPAWARDEEGPVPWRLDAYASFVRRVVERYGDRLGGVIIWNEPNLNVEWDHRSPDAAAYVELLKAGYEAVKAVDPDLTVLMGGLASTEGEGDWAINDLDYLESLYAAGAKPYFDVLTAHAYGFGRPPDDPPGKYRPNFRRPELYREIMAANGDDDKPIWVTEMGWLTWATDPKHDWQVVTSEQQADYIQGAIHYAEANYPWLERLTLWQLNSQGDVYGYPLWQGPEQMTPAYEALVAHCEQYRSDCRTPPVATPSATVSILAPDAIIRLGDRDILHPHWVHLYRGTGEASLAWQGEFFLAPEQAGQPFELLVETMQVNQATNRLLINGVEAAHLRPRVPPNLTSTWVTQRFSLPAEILRPGLNTMGIEAGPRDPAHQHNHRRWDNFQFRHLRLVPAQGIPPSSLGEWQAQPAPGSWNEISRLRPGPEGRLWLTGTRPGELWSGERDAQIETISLVNEAGNHPELVFNDILPLADGALTATDRGLLWRPAGRQAWQSVAEAPAGYAYTVIPYQGRFYAGFEGKGLWVADHPAGPWQTDPLTATSVIDLVVDGERLLATTEAGIFMRPSPNAAWEPFPLPGIPEADFDLTVEDPKDHLKPRLYPNQPAGLVVRHQNRVWGQEGDAWTLVGPDELQGRIYSVWGCCQPGMLLGTNRAGVWQLTEANGWQRLDGDTFEALGLTELMKIGGIFYATNGVGLFISLDGVTWWRAGGLPSSLTDLLVDPSDPQRWLAGTPTGVYRSQDGGQTWEAISPPWPIWDLAFGPTGRLFLARSNGLAWSDEVGGAEVAWQASQGLEQVFFFRVKPHPVEANLVWGGSWGNNVAASLDGGQTVKPIHNGLETLSVLDLIWHATPGQVTVGTIEGLYRTDDGGQSWFRLPGPLTHQTIHSLLQSDDGAIWAGASNGLWVSRDYGVTWEMAKGMPPATVLRLGKLVTPEGAQWLWAGTERAGLWFSRDGGASWLFGGLAGQSVYALFFDPVQPERLVAATDRGIFVTEE
jgi:photosystem II stability/assembly factor-like uncharacterized protein